MTTPEQFRAQVRARHRHSFDVYARVAAEMQALVAVPRTLTDLPARAVDMLFAQAFKTLTAIGELSTLALVEDTATLVRRQLELAVQAIYIARDSKESTRSQRAGMYLAFLWHKWPSALRARLPAAERQAWEALYREYGKAFTASRKSWGPNFRQMFEYAEQVDTYQQDYTHLSNIAHGAPPSLVYQYAQPTVALHDDREVGGLLLYASRYALATTMVWNDIFALATPDTLNGLRDLLLGAPGDGFGSDVTASDDGGPLPL